MLKLILKLFMFVPIMAGMMFVSYRVDPSGLFWGAGFERLASEYMLQGQYIDGYERLDGRALNEVFAKNIPQAPNILVNGSSRSMMINSDFARDGKTLYNAANVGADIYDFFTSYYIFEKENKTPDIFVMGIDAWLFNEGEDTIDRRSNKELYYEFLGEELGYENLEYEAPNPYEKFEALIDPSYFQGSVDYYFKDKSADVQPEPVRPEDIWEQAEVIKAPDGSIIYDKKFREWPQEVVDNVAMTTANERPTMRLGDYHELSPKYVKQFEEFIEYLQAKGVTVIFYIPPYHEYVYDSFVQYKSMYKCVFELEDYLNKTAEKYGIEVYGSYNPRKLGLERTDFYDGIHIKQDSIKKVLPVLG